MASKASDDSREVGDRLRRGRRELGLTLQEVADRAGLSKGYVGQVEAGTANPSLQVLKAIANVLGLVVGDLFTDSGEGGVPVYNEVASRPIALEVVRANGRKVLRWPGDGARDTFLLTPDLNRRLEVLLTTMDPGSSSGETKYAHEGEEFGFVLAGKFEVTVGDEAVVLEEGDSISFASSTPHRTRVIGDEAATTIWVVTPPSF